MPSSAPQCSVIGPWFPIKQMAWLLAAWLGLGVSLLAQQPGAPLTFDALHKQVSVRFGQTNVVVHFSVTNTSPAPVVIRDVTLSCGCSVASLPARPWNLPPGAQGQLTITTDLRGKRGSLVKTAIVQASTGTRVLTYQVDIQEPATPEERARNQTLAKADRQAVFRGDCTRCHVEPAKGKLGRELFTAACGICHAAEHRASMVPDLRTLRPPPNRANWERWITHGKPDTLMPAFAGKAGGPLTEDQVRSLVELLAGTSPGP